MLMIDQPTMYIPAEGQQSMLLLAQLGACKGCPAGVGAGDPAAAPPGYDVYAALATADAAITQALTLADLVLASAGDWAPIQLNDETPPTYCADSIEGPDIGSDGLWRLVMDQRIWTATVSIVTVYGLALVIVPTGDDPLTDGLIWAYGRLTDAPFVALDPGDTLKLTAELVPCLCLPPPVPEVPE